jgi:ribosomal protein S14
MRSILIKNNKSQVEYKKTEKIRILGKFLENYLHGCTSTRNLVCKLKDSKIFRKHYFSKMSRVRISARCVFTNRGRGVSKKHRTSRFVLRDFIQFGLLSGYRKAVW